MRNGTVRRPAPDEKQKGGPQPRERPETVKKLSKSGVGRDVGISRADTDPKGAAVMVRYAVQNVVAYGVLTAVAIALWWGIITLLRAFV